MRRIGLAAACALGLAAFGMAEVASAAWIHAKGWAAQELIGLAWNRTRHGAAPRAPWPGADWKPIARLRAPGNGGDVYVLDEPHARALAFGPAHLSGTAMPGDDGNSVIVAHRDTHFAFLRRVAIDDTLEVESAHGQRSRYRVRDLRVVERHDLEVTRRTAAPTLTLITCWPFDAVRPGTPLRYVVTAERE